MSLGFRSKDCDITIMLRHNHHHQMTFSICSDCPSDCYNWVTAVKLNIKLMIKGTRAQLKDTLIRLTVT